MRIERGLSGAFTYERVKLAVRGTDEDKYLMFPINRSEVDKVEELTGADWQNPGW